MNRYKAIVYLNGDSVQEMFDFSLQELKERLRKRIDEDATSHTPLTKAVLWTTEPAVWHSAAVHIQATLSERPCFRLLKTELWTKKSAPVTLFTEFLALKVRALLL